MSRGWCSCRNRRREIFRVDASQYIGLSHDGSDTKKKKTRDVHAHAYAVTRLIGETLITLYPFTVCAVERVIPTCLATAKVHRVQPAYNWMHLWKRER